MCKDPTSELSAGFKFVMIALIDPLFSGFVFVCAVLDLEKRIQDSIDSKDQKAKEVEDLLEAATELKDYISKKAMAEC